MNGVIAAGAIMHALTAAFYCLVAAVAGMVVLRLIRVSWPWILMYALIIFTVLWRYQMY